MGKPEASVETALCEGTKARGGWAAKVIDAGRRGAPDRELRFPGGRIFYVETKAKDGVLKPWQVEYHRDLRLLGFKVYTKWTVEQVEEFFWHWDRGCIEKDG